MQRNDLLASVAWAPTRRRRLAQGKGITNGDRRTQRYLPQARRHDPRGPGQATRRRVPQGHRQRLRLAQGKGIDLEVQKSGDESVLTFTPGENATASTASAEEEASAYCELPATTAAVIAVDSDAMGRGDAELGHILMKGLIYALAHQESVPKTMLFYNGGASLTCEGSESLEDIKELEARGTEILTCGTCLDFYGLREKLAVGGVTNLYAIAQILSSNPGVSVL